MISRVLTQFQRQELREAFLPDSKESPLSALAGLAGRMAHAAHLHQRSPRALTETLRCSTVVGESLCSCFSNL